MKTSFFTISFMSVNDCRFEVQSPSMVGFARICEHDDNRCQCKTADVDLTLRGEHKK